MIPPKKPSTTIYAIYTTIVWQNMPIYQFMASPSNSWSSSSASWPGEVYGGVTCELTPDIIHLNIDYVNSLGVPCTLYRNKVLGNGVSASLLYAVCTVYTFTMDFSIRQVPKALRCSHNSIARSNVLALPLRHMQPCTNLSWPCSHTRQAESVGASPTQHHFCPCCTGMVPKSCLLLFPNATAVRKDMTKTHTCVKQ